MTLMCCQNNSSHSFLLPAASAKGVAPVPCQALSCTSQPSSALSLENATNWNLIVDAALAVICWGDFLLEWQSHPFHSSKVAACTLVPSVSRVFQWLYSGCASVSSGPLSNSFNPGSSLQTDTTRVVLKTLPQINTSSNSNTQDRREMWNLTPTLENPGGCVNKKETGARREVDLSKHEVGVHYPVKPGSSQFYVTSSELTLKLQLTFAIML